MNLKKLSIFFQRNLNYLIIIAVGIVLFSASFGTSFLEMMRLIKLKNELTQEIAQSEELSSQLDEEIAQIGTQSYIERIARQYLELFYPNEQIVIPVENTMKKDSSTNNSKKQDNQNQSTSGTVPETENQESEGTQETPSEDEEQSDETESVEEPTEETESESEIPAETDEPAQEENTEENME